MDNVGSTTVSGGFFLAMKKLLQWFAYLDAGARGQAVGKVGLHNFWLCPPPRISKFELSRAARMAARMMPRWLDQLRGKVCSMREL